MMKKFFISGLIIGSLCQSVYASVNALDESQRTQFMREMSVWKYGDPLDKMNQFILDPSFNPFVKDAHGRTALDYSRKYQIKPIEYILQKKFYRKYYNNHSGKSMSEVFTGEDNKVDFVRAVAKGSFPAIQAFMSENETFNLNYELEGGISPLSATALIKDVDLSGKIFSYLIEKGANPNETLKYLSRDNLGHVFCASDNYLMMLLAISKGYDINLRNRDGLDVYEYSVKNNKKFCQSHLENIAKSNHGKIL
ncbi:hypothetical protein [Photobacterium galatheae]|nr:hypothetical protein [Photobacterium galatheae]MCM0149250.1 hypothetical protein [Photobacterium galatheae]